MPFFRPNALLLDVGHLTSAKKSHCSILSHKAKTLQYLSAVLVWDRRGKGKPAVSLLSKTIKSSDRLKWKQYMVAFLLTRFYHHFFHIFYEGFYIARTGLF